jgi:two-component system response regulator HydG
MTDRDMVILVVDDERDHADGLVEAVEKYCSKAIAVYTGKDAVEMIHTEKIDIVITDLNLRGDIDGLAILAEAKNFNPQTQVLLVTAYASINTCKEAMRQGAFDYIVKPVDIDQLRAIVDEAGRKILQGSSHAKAKGRQGGDFEFSGIRGQSPAMAGLFEVARRVAPTDISVLIEGESGTGKELLAWAIHENSRRRNRPFKPINCAGLTESLLESELFGHAKGSFTGAAADRMGLFEIADKGTLFLDEIGDMPLNMQAKLLRVLEDGVVTPVGSNKAIVVDVRVISATNHDLAKLVEKKEFRQDLYFRIKGVSITLPRLREQVEDIPVLINYFLKQSAAEIGSEVKGITDSALAILQGYDWPGNIRQLRNCIRTMVVMCDRGKLDVQDIPPEIHQPRRLAAGTPSDKAGVDLAGMALNELEKQAIIDTLAKTKNNREKAAKILGIGERTLYRKIREYNL